MSPIDLVPTPGQTVGPFFGYALPFERGHELVGAHHRDAVRLHGVVTDGAGQPVPDALIEIWQAAPDGTVPQEPGSLARDGHTFTGWGRCPTDRVGHFDFTTLEPGATEPDTAPFFAVCVLARGLMNRLFTRAYLPDDDTALAADRLLAAVAPERRDTLVARRDGDRSLRFDIRLQGDGETVFLSFPHTSAQH